MQDPAPAQLPAVTVMPVRSHDGHAFELIHQPACGQIRGWLYWLPAMGVPARHYRELAAHLAARGVAVVLHEWRGLGSSNWRAGRDRDWNYRQLLEQDLAAGYAQAMALYPQRPRVLGGHSLGGQLALIQASLQPELFHGLLLIASGAPYWRHFRHARAVQLLYQLAPAISRLRGYFPGRRLGFGGNEARGVISDWARSGREGMYRDPYDGQPLAPATAALQLPVLALCLAQDWLAPLASLQHLLAPMPAARIHTRQLDAQALGLAKADHFSWMQQPAGLVNPIIAWLRGEFSDTGGDKRCRMP